MTILRHELMPPADLLCRLKKTRLRGFEQAEVYREAKLEIVPDIDPEALAPAQRYVLEDSVQTVIDLAAAFAARDIDIFALEGGLLFWMENGVGKAEGPIPLTPPLIEESIEPDGRRVRIINDGMHRVFAARKLGRTMSIVLARGVPARYPYYAYALPGGWAEVAEIAELPDEYQKKAYRNPDDYKALFRNFNDVLPGVQKQRKRSNPRNLRAGS